MVILKMEACLILATKNVKVTSFDIYTYSTGLERVEEYFKKGSYEGFATNSFAWTKVADSSVAGKGQGVPTPIPSSAIIPVDILAGDTYSFYVTMVGDPDAGPKLRYTDGTFSTEDDNVKFIRGVGTPYPFGDPYSPRIWNGILRYAVC